MYTVYWIRKTEHTDIHTQGYAGITSNFKERLRAHKKSKKTNHLYHAKQKYGWDNLVIEQIKTELSLEEALSVEHELRPSQNIGWNSQKGGELGVEPSWYLIEDNSLRHREATSIATKKGIKNKDTPELRSIRAKENWIKNATSYIDISKGSNNSKALLDEDDVSVIKYLLIPNGMSNTEIAKMFGVKHYVISFIRSGKNWSHM